MASPMMDVWLEDMARPAALHRPTVRDALSTLNVSNRCDDVTR